MKSLSDRIKRLKSGDELVLRTGEHVLFSHRADETSMVLVCHDTTSDKSKHYITETQVEKVLP